LSPWQAPSLLLGLQLLLALLHLLLLRLEAFLLLWSASAVLPAPALR
jgi:hypothetical protein